MAIVQANIAMLGYTGSGKTCFMYGMYNAFKEGPEGFMLHTKNTKDEQGQFVSGDDLDLDFEDVWSQMRKGIYPDPTGEEPKNYAFEFRDGFNVLMDFDWTDYRGGVLRARQSSSTKDLPKITEKVRRADCVFLCIAGEHLQQAIEGRVGDTIADAAINRMFTFSKDVGPIPTVILITKSDLIQNRKAQEVQADVRVLFKQWFEDNRILMICPTSIVTRENLELPFVFTTHVAIRKKIDEAEAALQALKEEREGRTSGIMGWVRETFGNERNEELRKTIEQREADLKKLKDRIRPLGTRLAKASIYFKGQEMKVSV